MQPPCDSPAGFNSKDPLKFSRHLDVDADAHRLVYFRANSKAAIACCCVVAVK